MKIRMTNRGSETSSDEWHSVVLAAGDLLRVFTQPMPDGGTRPVDIEGIAGFDSTMFQVRADRDPPCNRPAPARSTMAEPKDGATPDQHQGGPRAIFQKRRPHRSARRHRG